jgi:hypothetical protein
MLKDIAELMRSVAALLWPIFAFILVLLFRSQLGLIDIQLIQNKEQAK